MIVNHVFIGRGPVKAGDLFNVLTWASLGVTVNIYVANPDKRADEVQHTYGSLFNLSQGLGNGASMAYNAEYLFSMYKIVDGQARGVADLVKLISLPATLLNHDQVVPAELRVQTSGWKTGILKFLAAASEWWPPGKAMNDDILQRVFTAVDATKFYLAATKQGLVCDMKVAPTPGFANYAGVIAEKFISYQRGNASATGFENQCSGSMCALTAAPRVTYATQGQTFGDGFGGKTVDQAARYFEQITGVHGKAMQTLVTRGLGAHSTKLGGKVVSDPEAGWTGPVCVFKHPKDQSWRGLSPSGSEKERAARDIAAMTQDALKMVGAGPFAAAMFEISRFPGFNIYA